MLTLKIHLARIKLRRNYYTPRIGNFKKEREMGRSRLVSELLL